MNKLYCKYCIVNKYIGLNWFVNVAMPIETHTGVRHRGESDVIVIIMKSHAKTTLNLCPCVYIIFYFIYLFVYNLYYSHKVNVWECKLRISLYSEIAMRAVK